MNGLDTILYTKFWQNQPISKFWISHYSTYCAYFFCFWEIKCRMALILHRLMYDLLLILCDVILMQSLSMFLIKYEINPAKFWRGFWLDQVERVKFQPVLGAAPCHSEAELLQRLQIHVAVVIFAVKHHTIYNIN